MDKMQDVFKHINNDICEMGIFETGKSKLNEKMKKRMKEQTFCRNK